TQTGTANSDVTTNPTSLIFTTDNWGTTQTVTVNAAEDPDGIDDSATLRISARDGGYDDVDDKEVVVTVDDNDTAGLVIVQATDPLAVTEGGSATFTVKLKTQPSDTVTVNLGGITGTDLTLSLTSLTFTASSWGTAQSVTVNAAEDEDTTDDTATITLGATGADYGDVTGSVAVNVSDNDTAGLVIVQATDPLAVTEGSNATFTVKLDTQPSGNVTVNITQPDNANADVTTTPASLTFTTDNWNATQTVTVNAAEDLDGIDDSTTLQLSATGGGYDDTDDEEVEVTVSDNDTAGYTFSATSLTVEEGFSATFTVKLDTQPSDDVKVTLKQPTNTDVTVDTDTVAAGSQNTLTFTTANWDKTQTVTVNTVTDADGADDSATINVSASGGGYDDVKGSVLVSVTDINKALVVSATDLSLTEGGSASFTVQLRAQPAGEVTVILSQNGVDANDDVTFDTDAGTVDSQDTLRFTADDWNKARKIQVSAGEDDDSADDTAKITLTASGAAHDGVTASVRVAVADNDTAGLKLSQTDLSVDEGDSAGFTVQLETKPSGAVTVVLRPPNNAYVSLSTALLRFTASNWNRPQTVTVSAAQDSNSADELETIGLRASGAGYDDLSAVVNVLVKDDDAAKLVVTPENLEVGEGERKPFSVTLRNQPTAAVTVVLTQPSNTDVKLDKVSLRFTRSSWNIGQTVWVSAAEDADAEDEVATVPMESRGGDYEGVIRNLKIAVKDDDTAGLLVTSASPQVNEGGTETFTVALLTQPRGDVEVTLAQPSNTDVAVDKTKLTFTTENWGDPQTVTLSAAHDDDAVNDRAIVALSTAGGSYDGHTWDVIVTVVDDDTAALLLSASEVELTEGEEVTVTVRLATRPTHTVRLDLNSSNPTVAAGHPQALTFTDANWMFEQSITITALQDPDVYNNRSALKLAASGGEYDDLSVEVLVKVIDDDKGASFARELEAVNRTLAELSRMTLNGAIDVIGRRYRRQDDDSITLAGSDVPLGEGGGRSGEGEGGEGDGTQISPDWDQLERADERLATDWFGSVPIARGQPAHSRWKNQRSNAPFLGGFMLSLNSRYRGTPGEFSFWGHQRTSQFSGGVNEIDYDGGQEQMYVGMDRNDKKRGLLYGIALAQSGGSLDYSLDGFAAQASADLALLLPYMEIAKPGGFMRVMLGLGAGDAEMTETSGQFSATDMRLGMLSFSTVWDLGHFLNDSIIISAVGAFGTTYSTTADSESRVAGNLNVFTQHVFAGFEFVFEGIGSRWNVLPTLQTSLRQDSGDGATGSGLELVGSMKWTDDADRIIINAYGHLLAVYTSEELAESGFGIEFRVVPLDILGRGLSVSVGPEWGTRQGGGIGMENAFELPDAVVGGAERQSPLGPSLNADIGFGVDAFGGMLTPYAEYSLGGSDNVATSTTAGGLKFRRRGGFEARLFAQQQRIGARSPRSRVGFQWKKRLD
ncbi:MAG: hypothetical protein ISN29_07495, partial [Gammaproteobacteria bacterium AqS3]|nr:hypothetical protein [Gammaproteobacteria bacterium AqS3]